VQARHGLDYAAFPKKLSDGRPPVKFDKGKVNAKKRSCNLLELPVYIFATDFSGSCTFPQERSIVAD
jgi:hypothetical protein